MMRGARKIENGARRGLGPFTGGQLFTIVVAVCAVFAIPTAALAAAGAFSNNSPTVPAVQGTNTNAQGVGVQGTGKKYGVFSNGPLGVADGRPLRCSGCVGAGALSKAAKAAQPLGTDDSESGAFSAAAGDSTSGLMVSTITFVRRAPVEPHAVYAVTWPVAHCSGPGHAERLYLCLYVQLESQASEAFVNFASITGTPAWGATIAWNVTGSGAYVQGIWTVTAA